jgi:hypothetical protein
MNILKSSTINQNNSTKASNNSPNKKPLLKNATLTTQQLKGSFTSKASNNKKGLQNKIEDNQDDCIIDKSPTLSVIEAKNTQTQETFEGYSPESRTLSPNNFLGLTSSIIDDKFKGSFCLENNDVCVDNDDKLIQCKVAARFRPFNMLENVYKYLIL